MIIQEIASWLIILGALFFLFKSRLFRPRAPKIGFIPKIDSEECEVIPEGRFALEGYLPDIPVGMTAEQYRDHLYQALREAASYYGYHWHTDRTYYEPFVKQILAILSGEGQLPWGNTLEQYIKNEGKFER